MSRTERVVAAVLLLSALVACASPTTPSSIAACENDDECQTGARCVSYTCVQNSPPTARFTVSGELRANLDVIFDGSGSADPDEGDSVTAYRWTAAKKAAECEAPTVANTTSTITLRFPCAGTFVVTLVVVDEMHAESAVFRQDVQIAGRTGSGLIEADPDQTVGHYCSGTPFQCWPTTDAYPQGGPVSLRATLANTSYQNVRWTVMAPPGRSIATGTGRTVTIENPNALQTRAFIVTDGAAISGDWDFRVELLNGAGAVVDAAMTRVSIGNLPPTIEFGSAGPFDHEYTASTQSYSAEGAIPVQFRDPENDPLTASVSGRSTVTRAGDFDVWPLPETGVPSQVGFSVKTLSAAQLIGPGVDRTVIVEASDVNGGSTTEPFSVVVGNRPPEQDKRISPTLAARHVFDLTAFEFTSSPLLGRWFDPDGDPLEFEVDAGSECTEALVVEGTVNVVCRAPGSSSLALFLRNRSAVVDVFEPWGPATSFNVVRFGIGNSAPIVNGASFTAYTTCSGGGSAGTYCYNVEAVTGTATLTVSDPDSDPLQISLPDGTKGTCTSTTCKVVVTVPAQISCSGSVPPPDDVFFAVTDGATTAAQRSFTPTVRCR